MKKIHILGSRKVAIIGAGYVGASIAYAVALRDIAREIVLIIKKKKQLERRRILVMGFQAWEQPIYMLAITQTARIATLSLLQPEGIENLVNPVSI